jgi:hypothetical protein
MPSCWRETEVVGRAGMRVGGEVLNGGWSALTFAA